MSIGAVWAVGRKGCELDGSFGSFGDFHGGFFATHFGFHPARVGRIDFYGGVFECVCQLDGIGVDGSFAGVVCGDFEIVDRRSWITVEGEGAEDATEIDDTTFGGFFEEREEGLGGFNEAEDVGLESISVDLNRDFVEGDAVVILADSGVIDENIEMPEFGFDGFNRIGDRAGI